MKYYVSVSLKANYDNYTVNVKQLGINQSSLNGFAMVKDENYEVGHGAKLEVLINRYPYLIEFDPPPENSDNEIKKIKRKVCETDDSLVENNNAKVMKIDSNDSEAKQASQNNWDDIEKGELHVFTSQGIQPSAKIAAFDMDGTLIKTKSGKVYPVSMNDWELAFSTIQKKLKEKFEEGYKIVILTNQAAIGNGRVKIEDFKRKIENIIEKLQVPVQAFIATGKGIYRKPATGMWKVLTEQVIIL